MKAGRIKHIGAALKAAGKAVILSAAFNHLYGLN